ncbi:DUF5602 domain-containing protein [Portibacter marinus]|uniref:DUF5602 domain-containing protein n=1 Tax=Portibacter marinus TaxID=2898660 RepID=UPI001F3ADD16|nr:DUF5602 domain-containing protein [Portibacter marinus]
MMVLTLSCTKNEDPIVELPTEYEGQKVAIGDGFAWSYVKTDANQTPTSIGIRFDGAVMDDLPTEGLLPTEFTLALPSEISVAPYDHITMDWNAHGHPPMMVYDLPHFDFHFYFMNEAERDQITPFDSVEFNKPLAPENLAPLYAETPGGVPRMGAHIIDVTSPEIAGTGKFTHTFLYGKYNGELNFLEPMVTKEFLDSKEHVEKEIRQPEKWMEEGFYPNAYRIHYDSNEDLHSLTLMNLQKFD